MTYGGYAYGSVPYGSSAESAPVTVALAPAVVEVVGPVVEADTAEIFVNLRPAVVEVVGATVTVKVGTRLDLQPAVVDVVGATVTIVSAGGVNLRPAVVEIAAPAAIIPDIVDLRPAVVDIAAPRMPRRFNIRAWTLDDYGSAAFGLEVQQEVTLQWGDPVAEVGWQPIRTNRITWAPIEVNAATGRPRTPTNVSVTLDPAVVDVAAPALQF